MSVAHCGTPNVIAVGGTAKKVCLQSSENNEKHDMYEIRCLMFVFVALVVCMCVDCCCYVGGETLRSSSICLISDGVLLKATRFC